jgi:phosphatidylglycerophosphate synthase
MVLGRYRGERIVNVPNAVTTVRVAGAVREAIRYYRAPRVGRLWAVGAFFSLDVVDGRLARSLNQTTQFGGDLDKVGDKVTTALLLAGGVRHRTADLPVLAAVTAINASNIAATGVATLRNSLPDDVPDVNRTTQALLNYGAGFNMIGNHLRREAKTPTGRTLGQALRVVAAGAALAGAALGTEATARLWRTVLREPTRV